MSVLDPVIELGNKDAIRRLLRALRIGGDDGRSERTGAGLKLQAGRGKQVLTELVVIVVILAIPSKIIWGMRASDLAYIRSTQASRASIQKQLAQGEALASKAAGEKVIQAKDLTKIPANVGYSAVVAALTDLSGRAGVQLTSVSAPSKKPAPIAGSVYQWSVAASVTGSFPAIQSFIDSIEGQPRLYQVVQAQVTVAGSSAGTGGAGQTASSGSAQASFSGGIDNALLTIDMETS